MKCRAVWNQLASYLEGNLAAPSARAVSLHLYTCGTCAGRCEEMRQERSGLVAAMRALPSRRAPQMLASRLRIAASHEVERHKGNLEFSTATRRWWMRLRLTMHDLMRPLAVPAAGGLLSSVVCFVFLAGVLSVPQQAALNDIPLGFTTQVTVDQLSPFGFTGHDVVVELTIDKEGRVANYAAHGAVSRDDMRQLGKLILFTSFAPATAFGQPTSGKILLSSNRINVRG